MRIIRYHITLIHAISEDLFGADDADWAIYRKIVRALLLMILTRRSLPSRRTPPPNLRMKKRTS